MKSIQRTAIQAAVIAGCVGGAGIYAGARGALSALLAGAIVTVFFVSTPIVLRPVMQTSPHASLLIAVVFFVTKVIAVLVLVTVLAGTRIMGMTTEPISLAVTMGVSAITWTILLIVSERTTRLPIYDLDDDDDIHA